MSTITPTFSGEVQLAAWSESHSGGCKVVLWLADPSDLDAFRALTVRKGNTAGHRFMAVLVEVGDDELPVQPEPEKPKGGVLAKEAAMLCDMPTFREFCEEQDAEGAADWIRFTCNVASRAELDNSERAAALFRSNVRGPYMKWKQSRGAA